MGSVPLSHGAKSGSAGGTRDSPPREEASSSLYPNESRAKRIAQARKPPQGSNPLPIADARKLEEASRICMGFHEAFGFLYDQIGLANITDSQQPMAWRLCKQAVLLRLEAANGTFPAVVQRGGSGGDVEKFGNYRNIRMMHGETVTFLFILLW